MTAMNQVRIIIMPVFCSAILFSPSAVQGQGASRFPPTTNHYANSGSDLGPLTAVRVQPGMPARMVPPGAMISVHDLDVPPKASKEFDRSMKAFRSGDFHSAAGHLKKAIEIDPDFIQAHNNLGATYINLREYDGAVAELQKTIELAPNLQEPYHNLGMALLLLHRLPEAEAAARRALDLRPKHSGARYTLGRILAMEEKNTLEAVELLSDSAGDIPDARLPLAQVLLRRGSLEQAIAELQAYLRNPDPAKKDLVEAWLAQITKEFASRHSSSDRSKS